MPPERCEKCPCPLHGERTAKGVAGMFVRLEQGIGPTFPGREAAGGRVGWKWPAAEMSRHGTAYDPTRPVPGVVICARTRQRECSRLGSPRIRRRFVRTPRGPSVDEVGEHKDAERGQDGQWPDEMADERRRSVVPLGHRPMALRRTREPKADASVA